MGISSEKFDAHKQLNESKFLNYRKSWPQHLYRHEPISNALRILEKGELLSRSDAAREQLIDVDIAPEEIINTTNAAHDFARLYFRPRNPTQFHIEGIRKPANYYNGKHAGFTIMLMFDAAKVLSLNSTKFSCGNMQSHLSDIYDGDSGFDNLDFDAIYHDVPNPSQSVIRQRCAEVLCSSRLSLPEVLKFIVVRTDADLASLKYYLATKSLNQYLPLARKTTGSGLFFDYYTAVEHIDTSPNRLNFKLAGTRSAGQIETKVEILTPDLTTVLFELNALVNGNTRYFIEHNLARGNYAVRFSLEGVFAHQSVIFLH
jgi:hypothetical protein